MLDVAVIGVGNMGRHHARIYSELPGVRLVAVADADEVRVQVVAARFGVRAYRDYRELLEHERLDAVSVVVPTREHLEVASEAIRAGLNLLVEKPLAATVPQAESLVHAAETRGVKLAVGHIERFNPAVRELKRLMEAGALGAISSVIARRVGLMPPQIRDANVIVDLAVHDIDVLNYLFGTLPLDVAASAGHALIEDRYDHAEIFLRYPCRAGGPCETAGCFVQVNWITPLRIRTLSVTGDAGHAELNYVTQKLELYSTNAAREYDDFGDFVVRFGEAARQTVAVPVVEPLRAELADFLQAISKDRSPEVEGRAGVDALRVAYRAIDALEG